MTTTVFEAEYQLRKAMDAQGKESSEKVLAYFNQALAIKPNHVTALNEKANYLDQIGKLEDAISYYDQALQVDPGSAEVWFNKGLTLKKMGNDTDAKACINKGIELAVG